MSVYAEVNHGRWIARCPKCSSAELARGARFECREQYGGCGHIDEIVYPSERAEIERALEGRLKHNRNWLPGEPPNLLHAENIEHAHEVRP